MTDPIELPEEHQASHDVSPLAQMLFGWTAHANAKRYIFLGMSGLSAVLILIDFLLHRHTYFPIEGFPAFYALYGFLAFAFVVVMGWPLRRLLGRSETYYDEDGADG